MEKIQRNEERKRFTLKRETVKSKKEKKSDGVTKDDKLSQLPDEIILRILSTLIVLNKMTRGEVTCNPVKMGI